MPASTYAVGDRVRVTDGPLSGVEAEVRETAQDRLRLAVDLRGEHFAINVLPSQVAPTSSPAVSQA
jgi:transcription antitermination factor NusG